MNDINNNYEDDIDYDMDYEENTEDDMNYENDISHGYKLHFRDNFAHWTSGDSKLDELIQNFQLNAPFSSQLIEWIEYSNLENIELIANGGFGSVYKAIWKDGPIIDWDPWDMNKHKWQRIGETIVAVKKFRNATQINSEFLNEVNNINFFYANIFMLKKNVLTI
ncbi:kinase-like domain-containing protein [Rhizophagus irregularis DAOM 181602=DAOM 197198]|nr:kinase-like domain-containing protein [Rhizophagus irregularis DAOM 181602=DAOM 197198]